VQVLHDLFYVLLHVLFYLRSRLNGRQYRLRSAGHRPTAKTIHSVVNNGSRGGFRCSEVYFTSLSLSLIIINVSQWTKSSKFLRHYSLRSMISRAASALAATMSICHAASNKKYHYRTTVEGMIGLALVLLCQWHRAKGYTIHSEWCPHLD